MARDTTQRPYGLTNREQQLMQLLADGQALKQISAIMGVQISAVHKYAERAARKMGTVSCAASVAKWIRETELPPAIHDAYTRGLIDGTRIRRAEVIQGLRVELDERQARRNAA